MKANKSVLIEKSCNAAKIYYKSMFFSKIGNKLSLLPENAFEGTWSFDFYMLELGQGLF